MIYEYKVNYYEEYNIIYYYCLSGSPFTTDPQYLKPNAPTQLLCGPCAVGGRDSCLVCVSRRLESRRVIITIQYYKLLYSANESGQ